MLSTQQLHIYKKLQNICLRFASRTLEGQTSVCEEPSAFAMFFLRETCQRLCQKMTSVFGILHFKKMMSKFTVIAIIFASASIYVLRCYMYAFRCPLIIIIDKCTPVNIHLPCITTISYYHEDTHVIDIFYMHVYYVHQRLMLQMFLGLKMMCSICI